MFFAKSTTFNVIFQEFISHERFDKKMEKIIEAS